MALLGRASGVASTPYQGFTGEETAPINAQQQAGIGTINQTVGNVHPLTAADIQTYQNPYTQDVINATQADFDTQNARAQSQVTGNAAAQGALGGDRVGVAQALTAEGQARAQAPVIAGLRSQGYGQALSAAEEQQKFGLQAGLQGAQAQLGAGTLEQQTQQAADTQARSDYYQQQGYPFQVAQWLASIDTAVGGSMGSTSTSSGNATTQGPTPNPWTQVAGLGLSAASLFAKDGGRITGKRAGFAMGGSPYGSIDTWVPTANVSAHAPTAHASLPGAPQVPKQQGLSQDQMKGFGALAQKGAGLFDSASYGGGNFLTDAYGGSASSPLEGLTAAEYGSWRGGRVKRYASGGFADGGDTFDDRFGAAFPNYVPITAGVGASKPAFGDAQAPIYDDGQGDFRLSTPEQLQDMRARKDRDNGRSIQKAAEDQGMPAPTLAAAPDVPELPPEINAGVSARRMTASAAPPEGADEGTEALGLAGPPQLTSGLGAPQTAPSPEQGKPSGGFLSSLGINMTPELRQGLLQAGLSMMATTRGGPGSFLAGLGEAGMTGVGAYTKTQEQALKQAQLEREQQIEAEKLKMAEESHAQQMATSPLVRDANGNLVPNEALLKYKQKEAENAQKDNWKLVPGDGISTPDRLYNSVTSEIKEVPPGKGQEALNIVQNGQFNYVAGGPKVEKGDTPPEPKPIPGFSSDAIKDDAAYYLVTGDLPKASVSPRNPMGMQSVAYQRLIRNYGATLLASKGLTADDFADLRRFGKQAARFPLSKQGDQTVAIGTAIRHIGALEEYAKVWDAAKGNWNAPIVRQAAARFAKALGKEEPTNLEQAARIAGPEIIKAIGVAGAGTGGERFAQEEGFQPGASTPQILGSANVARTFLAGQLPAKEAQASAVHFPHEKFMSMVGPQEYDYLSAINHGKPAEDHGATNNPAVTAHPQNAVGTKSDVNGIKWYVDKDGNAISKVP